jgi:uncharacterized protein
MMATKNPFITNGYESKELFCDREVELGILHKNVSNGIDTTLVSPRRMGKTGLIHRFFDDLREIGDMESVFVDIYAARSLDDFIKLLAEAILVKFPAKTSIGERFMEFIKGFRPLIGYDALTGEPQIQINYQSAQDKEYGLRGLLQFLDSQNRKIVVAIDEFQQIAEFPEKNIEALLRTCMQQLVNTRFIFCGSKQSMMVELFSNAKRPFYSSTQYLGIDRIDAEVYGSFIRNTFYNNGGRIDDEAIDLILEWTKRHTFYTQSLCNSVFSSEVRNVNRDVVRSCCADIVKRNEALYFQFRQLVTPAQWNFMIAIAKEGMVTQIAAQKFIAKYNIGTPANARRIAKSLIEKELILETHSKKETSYQLYDVFLSRWMESEY